MINPDKLAAKHEKQSARLIYRALKLQYGVLAGMVERGSKPELYMDYIKQAVRQMHSVIQLQTADWQYNYLTSTNQIKALQVGIENRILTKIKAWILLNTGESIKQISATSLEIIRKKIAEGQQAGYGAAKIANLIRQEAKSDFTVYRATVIARTEGTRAAAQGHLFGAQEWENITGEKKWKQWSASSDLHTRDWHLAMIGTKAIPGDQDFIVDGASMSAPGDPRGGGINTINCRCRVVYMSVRLAKKINNKN